jgi:nitrite reductase (cytochrome c-552)
MKARVDAIQERSHGLLQRGGVAIVALIDALKAAKDAGAPAERLAAAQRLQRRAQWRLDFIAAENSMGFHAPQEAARILAEAIDFARQGELLARGLLPRADAPLAADGPDAKPAPASD